MANLATVVVYGVRGVYDNEKDGWLIHCIISKIYLVRQH
jgi:hypothetical protein